MGSCEKKRIYGWQKFGGKCPKGVQRRIVLLAAMSSSLGWPDFEDANCGSLLLLARWNCNRVEIESRNHGMRAHATSNCLNSEGSPFSDLFSCVMSNVQTALQQRFSFFHPCTFS